MLNGKESQTSHCISTKTQLSLCLIINASFTMLPLCDNIGLVSLIYLGWELSVVYMSMYVTVLCLQAILILSAYFLCQPYIPLSNSKNFSFTLTV